MFDPLRECVCGEFILPLDRHYGYFLFTIAGSFYNVPKSINRQYHRQEQDQGGYQQDGCHDQRLNLYRVGGHTDGDGLLEIINPVATDQQAVGIDAVGGAGDQRTQVPALDDRQFIHFLGLHDADLVHLVGEGLVEDIQHEIVALFKLVKVSEQPCGGQAPVAGKDTVGALAADRQAGPFQMANGDLQTASSVPW